MTRPSVRRGAAALLTTVLAATAAATAQPASAGSMFFSKTSGRLAEAAWLEIGPLPGVPGNIHFGQFTIEELSRGNANIWGTVIDLTCPEGYVPDGPPGGGHGEPEPEPSPCTHEGQRFIENNGATFTMDRKLNTATLTGRLSVFGHDGPLGSPAVDMTWTGVGDAYTSTQSGRYSDGTSTYSYRYTFTGRAAQVSGRIGPMVFDDVAGEWSTASMGSFREASRSRTA